MLVKKDGKPTSKELAVPVENEMVARARALAAVGTARYCLPCHRILFESIYEGLSKVRRMTWR